MAPLGRTRRPVRSLGAEAVVLTKAVGRVAERLSLSNGELARVLGMSDSSASRLRSGTYALNANNKEFELGALLVRAFRSLDAILGGDGSSMNSWMRTENSALRGVPLLLIQSSTLR